MGLRFKKSIKLGKGVRLNISKSGVGISGGVKGFRVGMGPKGLRTTASIPGTGISYVKENSLGKGSKSKEKPRIEVQSKSAYSAYLPQEVPKELKSDKYHLQGILGFIGIAFIFASYKNLIFMLIGLLFIFGKGAWRKKTDYAAKNYRDAVNFYKMRKYQQCIQSIDEVFTHPQAQADLYLAKAECLLELDDVNLAYRVYQKYFNSINPATLSSIDYWSPKANAIAMAIENKDYDFALKIIETLPEEEIQDIHFPLWKNFFKGLCFMGNEQYEIAIEAFKKAVGRKRKMEEPYIDCHYYMGIAYTRLGKTSLAHQRFQRVYASNTGYKNIASIMEAISSGKDILHLMKEK